MTTIYKYPLQLADSQTVMLPFGADVLSVQYQGDALCLWAMVELENTREPRRIFIYGTGHEVKQTGLRYIGTVQQLQGRLIWHVFEQP